MGKEFLFKASQVKHYLHHQSSIVACADVFFARRRSDYNPSSGIFGNVFLLREAITDETGEKPYVIPAEKPCFEIHFLPYRCIFGKTGLDIIRRGTKDYLLFLQNLKGEQLMDVELIVGWTNPEMAKLAVRQLGFQSTTSMKMINIFIRIGFDRTVFVYATPEELLEKRRELEQRKIVSGFRDKISV